MLLTKINSFQNFCSPLLSPDRFGLGLGLKSSKKKTTKGKGKKTAKILLRPSKADRKHVDEMKANLLEKIEAFGARLPQNSLDQLIDELGGPNVVAEVLSIRQFIEKTVYLIHARI